jgi:hypothetical protein
MNESLSEALARLAKSVADYKAFVAGSHSQQLAIEGVKGEAR